MFLSPWDFWCELSSTNFPLFSVRSAIALHTFAILHLAPGPTENIGSFAALFYSGQYAIPLKSLHLRGDS